MHTSSKHLVRRRTAARTTLVALLVAVLGGTVGVVAGAPPAGAAIAKVNTSVSLSNANPFTGQQFTVNIGYACSSATVNCLNAALTMTVPAGLDTPTGITTTPHVSASSYNAATRVLSFTFVNPLSAGATGQVSFTTAFTQGPTPDKLQVSFTSTMTATGATKTSPAATATAHVNNWWAVQKTVVTAGPVTGNSVYSVRACRGAATVGQINLTDATLVDSLPVNAVFVSATGGGVYNAVTRKVTWAVGATAASSGCTTAFTLTLGYPQPPFNAGDTITNNLAGSGHVPGLVGPAATSLGTTTAIHVLGPVSASFSVTKVANQGTVVAGQTMPWTVTVTNSGNVPVAPYWTDYFPQGLSILPGGAITIGNTLGLRVNISYSVATNPRSPGSWHLVAGGPFIGASAATSVAAPAVLPGSAAGITALRYDYVDRMPIAATVSVKNMLYYSGLDDTGAVIPNGTRLINCATVYWTWGTLHSAQSCAGANSALPSPTVAVSKAAQATYLVPGRPMPWNITVTNNGNVPGTWTAVDIFPQGLAIPPGGNVGVGNTAGNSVDIWISVARSPRSTPTWYKLAGGPFAGASTTAFTPAPATLPAGGTGITGVKYVFSAPMAIGASWTVQEPTVFSTLDDAGVTIANGTVLQNCAHVTSTFGATTKNGQGCATRTVTPMIEIQASKNIGAAAPVANIGTQVTFPLQMSSTTNSWYGVTDPVVADIVPAQAGPWNGTWAASFTVNSLAGTTFVAANDFSTTPMSGGRTALRWKFHGTLAPGSFINVSLRVKALFDLPSVNYDDHLWTGGTMAVTPTCSYSAANGGLGIAADTENVLGFGAAYQACHSKWAFQVAPYAALDSTALVHGQLDGGYSSTGRSVPGGLADYRLQVTNSGNVDMTNAVVVDVLPWVGDTEVLSSTPRGSQYHPNLAGPVVPSDPAITVYYSTTNDPCEAAIGITVACTNAGWSTTPPADITTVASVKFAFNALVLHPGATFQLDWPMRVPNATPAGKVAWDTFAYTATRVDNGQTLLPSEPNAIGIDVNTASLNVYGDRVWADANNDGIQNAGEGGINGVIVRLYTSTGTFVAQTVSGNDFNGNAGYYSFPNLPDGDYYAVFDLTTMPYLGQPSPFEVAYPANKLVDSDANISTGRTPTVHLAGSTVDNSWDFGIFVCVSDVGC